MQVKFIQMRFHRDPSLRELGAFGLREDALPQARPRRGRMAIARSVNIVRTYLDRDMARRLAHLPR